MKKLALLISIVIFTAGVYSQETKIGIKGGLNYAYINGSSIQEVNPSFTYHAGVLLKIGFTDIVALQPEFLFSVKGIESDNYSVDLNYLDVPLLLKVKLGDLISLHAGPQLSYLLSINEDGSIGVDLEDQIKNFDLGVAGGLELEMESGLSLGARYSFSVESIGTDYSIEIQDPSDATKTITNNVEAPDYKNGVVQVFAAFHF